MVDEELVLFEHLASDERLKRHTFRQIILAQDMIVEEFSSVEEEPALLFVDFAEVLRFAVFNSGRCQELHLGVAMLGGPNGEVDQSFLDFFRRG